MTERISSDSPRNLCYQPEDERPQAIAREKPGPACRDRLVSESPPDWNNVPTSCEANAADAARNAGEGGMCGGRWPGAPMSSGGSTPDPRSVSPPRKEEPSSPTKQPRPTAGASRNAARTTERGALEGSYAAAGVTHDGRSAFAGVALVKGGTKNGLEAEAGSLSVQAGLQNEAQATFVRAGVSGERGAASLETLTANVHAGIDNSDGSVGLNVGASATLVGTEATLQHSGNSFTVGLAAGLGVGGHFGVRDQDKNGKPEICFRATAGPVTIGGCNEVPIVIRP